MIESAAVAFSGATILYALTRAAARHHRTRAADGLRIVMEEARALEALRRATSRVVVSAATYGQLGDRFPLDAHTGISVFVAERVGPDEVAYIVPAYEATLFDQDDHGDAAAVQ